MARRRKYQPEPDKDPELDISSLIDVSFLLLIYFLVTSTLQKKETDVMITLPSESTPTNEQPRIDPMFIKVTTQGGIVVDGAETDPPSDPTISSNLPGLFDKLRLYRQSLVDEDQPIVIVDAEDDGKNQRLVDVMNLLVHEDVKIQTVTLTGFVEK